MKTLHASCATHNGHGVLLRGPSGIGKSDLCLRLISQGFRLVADDQVELKSVGKILLGTPPIRIRGLLEVRGVGIMRIAYAVSTPICLVVDLVEPEFIERLPEESIFEFKEVSVPRIKINPFESSVIEKISLALSPANFVSHVGLKLP
tara:strand:- start:23956 stop:24399 length:444 start_codon:yes stop_codon:yes gene_type:complete